MITAGVHKFKKTQRLVFSCNKSGTTDDQVLLKAEAMNFGKLLEISYDFKDLVHDVWMYNLAYKALQTHSKFIFQQPMKTKGIARGIALAVIAKNPSIADGPTLHK